MSQRRRLSGRPLVTDRGDAESEKGCPRPRIGTQPCWGFESSSQPRVAPCGCNGSCGLLFRQQDPAYLGSAVCVDGELMLRAQRRKEL